jgi:hypothetical protein
MIMSKPLQVYLEEADLDRLEQWSRARGWTKSQTIRAAVRALTRSGASKDSLFAASGMIDGLPSDVSEHFDAYLDATFVAEGAAPYRGKSTKRRQRPR